mmetsp:Transcript_70091/g.194862  ORF Transcript_70091/g.194862 Transcript_70091/m.194862 type:complete len:263 (+) Transcript_70091:1650-2438(+)
MGPAGLPRQSRRGGSLAGKGHRYFRDARRGVHCASGLRPGFLQQTYQAAQGPPPLRRDPDEAILVHHQALRWACQLLLRHFLGQEQGSVVERYRELHWRKQHAIRRVDVQERREVRRDSQRRSEPQEGGGRRRKEEEILRVVRVQGPVVFPHGDRRYHGASFHQVHQAEPAELARFVRQERRDGAAAIRRCPAGGAGEPRRLPSAHQPPGVLGRLQGHRIGAGRVWAQACGRREVARAEIARTPYNGAQHPEVQPRKRLGCG